MDNPVLSFYTYDLEYIGTIGTYTSLQWENKMHSAGDIEIHIPIPYFNILGSAVSLDCFVKIERGVKEAYGVIHYRTFGGWHRQRRMYNKRQNTFISLELAHAFPEICGRIRLGEY